jgi:hypothetical protein
MVPRLKKNGAMADQLNMFRVFKKPITRADQETRRRKGNIIWVKRVVRKSFEGSSRKPKATSRTIQGENAIPRRHAAPTMSVKPLKAAETNFSDWSFEA